MSEKILTETIRVEILKLYPEFNSLTEYKKSKDGRYRVRLYGNGKELITQRARLLLEVKIGRRLVGEETVDHVDNNKSNDSFANLQILSRSENARKGSLGNSSRLGHKQTASQKRNGSKNGRAKLDETEVEFLRLLFASNFLTKKDIIEITKMSDKGVRNMLYGVTYREAKFIVKPRSVGRPRQRV